MKHLFALFFFLQVFSANGQENATKDDNYGDNFLGSWHCITNNTELISISRNGSSYLLSKDGATVTMTLAGKVLKNDDPTNGQVIYNSLNGHVFWLKKEYEAIVAQADTSAAGQEPPNTPTPPQTPMVADSASTPIVYSAATVNDFFGDNINSPENQLFKFVADYRSENLYYFDMNMHEQLPENQNVADEILYGFIATGRFKRVEPANINSVSNDTISYFVGYTDINIQYQESARSNGTISYHAVVSARIQVKNSVGTVIHEKLLTTKAGILTRYFTTTQAAVKQGASDLGIDVTNYLNGIFNIVTTVKAIDDVNKKGEAKTIILNGGGNIGFYKPGLFSAEFALKINDNGHEIGRVRVKTVEDSTTICRVEEGGAEIAAAIAAGKKLEAISE